MEVSRREGGCRAERPDINYYVASSQVRASSVLLIAPRNHVHHTARAAFTASCPRAVWLSVCLVLW